MKTILSILAVLAFLIGNVALATEEQQKNNDNGLRVSISYAPTAYTLSGVKPASVPVNPDDAGFLSGNTEVVAGNGADWYNFELSLSKAFRIEEWTGKNCSTMPVVGVSLQLSALSSQSDSPDRSMIATKQQSSDTRDAAHGSFVYDKLTPGIVAPIPFIGLEINVGQLVIAPELGFAYKQFKRESGDYRFGGFSPTTSKSEWAFGLRPLIRISYKCDESSEIGVFAAYETYKYSSIGRINGLSFGPTFALRF